MKSNREDVDRGNLHHEPRLLFRVVSGCHFMRTQPTSNSEAQVVLEGRAGEGSNKATGVSTKQYRCGQVELLGGVSCFGNLEGFFSLS